MSQQINLYNPAFEYKKQILTAASMAAALGVLIVGLVVLVALGEVRLARLQGEATAGAQRLGQAQKRLADANAAFAPRSADTGLTTQLQDAQAERAGLQRVADVIARGDLGDTRGYAEYFRALARRNVEGVWLTGVGIGAAGNDISLRGRALDGALVPGYVSGLRNEPVLQGKAIGSLQIGQGAAVKVRDADGKETEAPAPYVEFSLQSAAPAAPGAQP